MRVAWPLCSLLVLAASAAGQIRLTADVNTRPGRNPGSSPAQPIRLGAWTYFVAERTDVGRELFRTKGTTATTELVRDINPGRADSGPTEIVKVGSTLFFGADDGVSGRELWKSAGTAATTVRVADLVPGAGSSKPKGLAALGSLVLFSALDTQGIPRLHRSDGTAAGTVKIHDSRLSEVWAGSKLVWYSGLGHLVRTDGTTAGTFFVGSSGTVRANPPVVEMGGLYYFGTCTTNSGSSDGTRLMASNGKNAAEVYKWPTGRYCAGALVRPLAVHNGWLWLAVAGTGLGQELWRSDGTAAGTTRVKDFAVAWPPPQLERIVGIGKGVYFNGPLGKLWRSDGTAPGTSLVTSNQIVPESLTVIGNRLFFASEDAAGFEPWVSDGTPAGTRRLADLWPGPTSSSPAHFAALPNGDVLFGADDGVHGEEMFTTNTSVTRLIDVNSGPTTAGSDPTILGEVNGAVLFSADDGTRGMELWSTGGTAVSTRIVADLLPGPAGSYPEQGVVLGREMFFFAGGSGKQLHRTDGTAAGTQRLTNFAGGVTESICVAHGRVYFGVHEASTVGLFYFDPAKGVARRLRGFAAPMAWDMELTKVGAFVYFIGYEQASGLEIWRTDGTSLGTRLVWDAYPGAGTIAPSDLFAHRGRLFFVGNRYFYGGRCLLTTNGTKHEEIYTALEPRGFTSALGRLYMSAMDGKYRRLFVTDGTVNGTGVVTTHVDSVQKPVAVGNRLLFAASRLGVGTELWETDGILRYPRLVAEVEPGRGGHITGLVAVGSRRVAFIGTSVGAGTELYLSDGTAAGTHMVANLNPGPHSGLAPGYGLRPAGGDLYFRGDDGKHGAELFRYFPGATSQRIGQRCGPTAVRLFATDPVIGGAMKINAHNIPQPYRGFLSIGFGPTVPLFDCFAYVSQPVVILPVPGWWWDLQFQIPLDPTTAGVRVLAQGIFLNPAAPRGVELTTAVLLTLGR